jgi:uncharacterized protein YkwD
MPRLPRAAVAAALLLLIGPAAARAQTDPCSQADLQPKVDEVPSYERAVVCLVNVERAQRDRGRLRVDPELARAGRRQSADMVERHYFSHVRPGGWDLVDRLRSAGYRMSAAGGWSVGEVLSWGVSWRATPRATVDAWMESPPHRAALLRPEFDEVGAGAALGNPLRDAWLGVTVSVELGHVG